MKYLSFPVLLRWCVPAIGVLALLVIASQSQAQLAREMETLRNVDADAIRAAIPNLKISVQWGSSNVGSGPDGPKLTAYISVTNTSKVDCHPPAGAQFVVGAYYKTLGLMKATSVGTFPTVIPAGETRNFVQQSLDDAHQSVIYNGSVDFYVSSQAPGEYDLSTAVRPACKGEINLGDNNAHSVKKVMANP
jgi:hypothetical protein